MIAPFRRPLAHPLPLAALRVAVVTLILTSPELREGPAWAAMSPALRTPPEGLAWFAAHAPIDAMVARVAQAFCVFSGLLAIAGVHARVALIGVLASGGYVFALAQLGGTVTHDMHLFWFVAILASSRCADALAWDAGTWLGRGHPRSVTYGWPLLLVGLSFGVIYFFPGLWKLRESGLDWALGPNLANQMHCKWFESRWLPIVRVDRVPWMLHASGLFVIAFELSFPLLVVAGPRARVFAALAGLGFHLATDALLHIRFPSLWVCYVALIPFGTRAPVAAARVPRLAIATGAAIVALAAIQGSRGAVSAWPFACYPTFQWAAPDRLPDLAVTATFADGSTRELPRGARASRSWGVVWALMANPTRERLAAHLADLERRDPWLREASRVRFERVWCDVDPDRWSAPPLARETLVEITR